MQGPLTSANWEAYCTAEDTPLDVLFEESAATSASDVMTKACLTDPLIQIVQWSQCGLHPTHANDCFMART